MRIRRRPVTGVAGGCFRNDSSAFNSSYLRRGRGMEADRQRRRGRQVAIRAGCTDGFPGIFEHWRPSLAVAATLVQLILCLGCVRECVAQNLEIYGSVADSDNLIDPETIYTECFGGFRLDSCSMNQGFDIKMPDNYNRVTGDVEWCLACCSDHQNLDVWDMTCDVTPAQLQRANSFGWEFRLARNHNPDDKVVHRCPIWRSACEYNKTTGELIEECSGDNSFITGYKLYLEVEERSGLFSYWREVKSCNMTVYESLEEPETLAVRVEMYHPPVASFPLLYFFLAFFFVLLLVALFYLTKVLRTEKCVVCGAQLVLTRQSNRCYYCRKYGCDEPAEGILKVMECRKVSEVPGEDRDRVIRMYGTHEYTIQDLAKDIVKQEEEAASRAKRGRGRRKRSVAPAPWGGSHSNQVRNIRVQPKPRATSP